VISYKQVHYADIITNYIQNNFKNTKFKNPFLKCIKIDEFTKFLIFFLKTCILNLCHLLAGLSIRRRIWNWIEHALRQSTHSIAKQVSQWMS